MHSNAGDSVSVDAFKKSKSSRGRGPPVGRGRGGRGGARGGYCSRPQSGYHQQSSDRRGKCSNCGTSHQPRQCSAYGQTCYNCGRSGHYAHYCRSTQCSSTPGRHSHRDIHDMEQAENFEYDAIQVVQKITFGPNCYKDCSAYDGNVMFDEIASVKKHNLRVLSDLLVASHSHKHTVRFKLDTGAGGNMLPYDVWQRFFPGRSNADLARTIDQNVSLQAYNKSEIHQLGTCSLTVSHNGVSHTCHFFVVPSQYRPILGLSDLLTLHLVTFNCPTTTSWSSCTSVDALTCNAINETVVPVRPLTLTDQCA